MPRKQRELRPNASPNDEAGCYVEYEERMGNIAREKQAIAALFNRYEKLGVHTQAIKHAYIMVHKKDAQELHRQRTATMARLGIIEWDADGQGSFLKGVTIEAPSGDAAVKLALGRAKAAGYNDGLAGAKVGSCPHPAGSEEFVVWRDGWEQGHADRLEKDPDADKPKPAKGGSGRGRRKRSQPEVTP
jgi:ribosome modulation factor